MPLKIELKPKERIIIGNALITNDEERIRFYIEGDVPILREKFILREKDADTPSKRIYFVIQQMYLAGSDVAKLQKVYIELVKDLQSAAPSLISYIAPINDSVFNNDFYQAIKLANKLIEKENELFGSALKGKL